jgi:hypothetical protein
MKAQVTANSQSLPPAVVGRNYHSHYQYKKVRDGRKQLIRGIGEHREKFAGANGVRRIRSIYFVGRDRIKSA